ncbi:MAG: hypothetical protein RI997_1238 [Pseudomonadota bacterium]|jgi:hypothetical protein
MRGFYDLSRISRPVLRVMLAGSIALAGVLAQPSFASAKNRVSPGEAAAFGIIGGLALGAILGNSGRGGGSVYVGQNHGYGDENFGYQPRPRYHQPRPVYYAPQPVYYPPQHYPECYQVQERVWVRGWGWQLHRRTVCE